MKPFTVRQSAHGELQRLLGPVLQASADRIAARCNSESRWGFYGTETQEAQTFYGSRTGRNHPLAIVWAYNARSDARTNRLLRNLDAGRVL